MMEKVPGASKFHTLQKIHGLTTSAITIIRFAFFQGPNKFNTITDNQILTL